MKNGAKMFEKILIGTQSFIYFNHKDKYLVQCQH